VPVPGMSAPISPGAGDLRVATLNLWGGYYPVREHVLGRIRPGAERHPAWSERQSALAAGLRELQLDLVAFQEALKTDVHDQVVELLGPGYYLAHQTGREADGSGASIASRWPFEAVHEVDLHVAPRIQGEFPCVTLLAEVAAPEPVGPLLFANHNPNSGLDFEHERELQAVTGARAIQEFVERRRLHVVVAGDFDTTPDAASGRFWRGRQSLEGTSVCYWDAWEHPPGRPRPHLHA
jgi:endonuclease/exonuclease/phosphatase family metal-dependent hydrolase